MNEVALTVYRDGRQVFTGNLPLPLELGRLREEDSGPFSLQDLGSYFRVAITPADVLSVPREAIRIEGGPSGVVLIRNVHRTLSFELQGEQRYLFPGETVVVSRVSQISLPSGFEVSVAVLSGSERMASKADDDDDSMRTMQGAFSSVELEEAPASLNAFLNDDASVDRGKIIVALVNQALEVVQKSAGSDEFLDAAVKSAAQMISLDNAYVILRDGSNWRVVSANSRQQNTSWQQDEAGDTMVLPAGSTQILSRLLRDEQTVVFEPKSFMYTAGSSLLLLDRAVASPLMDADRNIMGALYGDRKLGSDSADVPIGDLEAALLEVMAGAVSAGILRQREEQARRREEHLRSSMNQFFSPEVLSRLQQNENLLEGRDAEVTVLFCDIRGFSLISERIGPRQTIQWINDVFTTLSQCVLDTDGVLVDYIGDELMAMWGAPDEQIDHAARACQAALAMVGQIEPIRERWKEITPNRFGIGIGVNTGMAQVGNTGSLLKFKYGPLGNTVNIASRIQGMTKQFGVTTLVSESTLASVRSNPYQAIEGESVNLQFRRIAEVQPVGVQSHLLIHQLASNPNASWTELRDRYEQALSAYCDGQPTQSAAELIKLVANFPDDEPSLLLLQRVVDSIAAKNTEVDHVIRLVRK
ncbi:adenylate/guanylate cyclase domain-containing protein [Aporhodopirellula aestuarii]|uniref:Adenylate/guanylate cyclase domain-containing protein n=1 Tax=Aporhodopirellula aestuarii TaxID=2950107 RepID=A0ABT0UDW0_9BACT|nr:adenylate/guanylate cyclase domain-containing protein [Aporhodopirellula aestuarii]MCM2374919.1 adenylate/guanylate cyclase domain-containing protein [Aporhodopirellula aestuarii]